MAHYGNDKPDTRFGFLIEDYSKQLATKYNKKFVKAIVFDRNINEHKQIINETFKKNNGQILDIFDLKEANKNEFQCLLDKAKEDNISTP